MKLRSKKSLRRTHVPAVLLISTAFMLLGGCLGVPSIDPPAGFAQYEDDKAVTAISPEGVRYRARYARHEPEQDLDFWKEAMKVHFENSGYVLVSEDEFSSSGGEGVLFEWAAPVGQEDWIYLTAVSIHEEKIAIVEAAGPFQHFKTHRPEIMESLKSLSR